MWHNMRTSSWLLLMLLWPAALPAAPGPGELKTTLDALKSSRQEEARLKEALTETTKTLDTLRKQATSNALSVQQAERNASTAEAKLEATIQALDKANAEYAIKRDAYAHTLRHLLALRKLPPSAFFGNTDDVNIMLKTASVLEVVHKQLALRAGEIAKTISKLDALKKRLSDDQNYNATRQKRLEEQNAKLTRDLEARQKLQAELARNHAQAEARVKAFAKQSRNLQELISKLETSAPATPPATQPKATAKGAWQSPVAGRVLHRFNERKGANERWHGMVFAARPGGSVIAPGAGEVVFTGPFRDYGPMVLVRHRDGYISLIAGLADIRVTLGQNVRASEPIGRMGTEPSPALYVELRQGSKTIDPAAWFANLSNHLAATP